MSELFYKSILNLLTGICLITFYSCDKINDPYQKSKGHASPPSASYVKKILLEDYTAQQCIYCPQAATIAKLLRKSYPGRVITVGIHVSSLAQPGPVPFDYDFRTAAGDSYDASFGLSASGLPTGMVDRIQYQGSFPIDRNNWQSVASAELALPCVAFLRITNNYNPSTRILNTSVNTKFLSSVAGSFNLVVLLTEDSIVKAQKDVDSTQYANDIVLNYLHRYVLRTAMNGNSTGNGEPLVLPHNPIIPGDSITKSYSYQIPAAFPATAPHIPCNDKHCYVVAFLFDSSNNQILQAEEQKLW
jgi:hypothetical protein